jgi:hypothetical protein
MSNNLQHFLRKLDTDWKTMMLGVWEQTYEHVHLREDISQMLECGAISKEEADRLMRMHYVLNSRGEKVVRYDGHP